MINRRNFISATVVGAAGTAASTGLQATGEIGVEAPFQKPEIITYNLKDDGLFPNSVHPLIIYRAALRPQEGGAASAIEALIHKNGWGNNWRNGIYPFHHYHSTAHEVLLVYRGEAKVTLGGPKGITSTIKSGDVVLIPAGVGHKNLGSKGGFRVIGAYPPGQSWDMQYGKAGERPKSDQNIAKVPLPEVDPIYGRKGPLLELWKDRKG